MASTAEGKALTEAHRVGQIAIGAQAEIELRLLWPMLDPSNLDRSEPAWMAASLVSMRPHYEDSTRLASAYMREYRRAEGDGSGAIVRPAWDQQYMAENLHLAGPVRVKLLTQAGAGADVAAAVAATKFAGIGRRGVMSGGRTAIHETAARDSRVTGWRRVTDGDPCTFCAMLATRGPVYGKDTVKLTGEGLEFHGHCGCTGELIYGEWEPNAVEQSFIDEYNRAAAEVDALNQPRYQYNVLPRMRANGTFKDSPLRRNITSGP